MELFFDNVNYVIDREKVAETIAELHAIMAELGVVVEGE